MRTPWRQLALKRVCDLSAAYGANLSSDAYQPDGVRFVRTTDIQDDGSLTATGVYVSASDAAEYMLRDGDLLLSRSGTLGQCLLYEAEAHGPCSYAAYLVRFSPGRELEPKFAYYYFKSADFNAWLDSVAVASTISNVNGQKYASMPITAPPVKVQRRIVEHLDSETSRIDGLIDRKQRFIDLLLEKRTALITHAVTKGLDPNADMKDSGVPWVGEIPQHWSLMRVRHLCDVTTGGSDTVDANPDAEYPFFVRSQVVERINTYSYDGEAVLTAGDGAGVAKVFHHHVGKFDYHQRVYAFTRFRHVTGRFFFHFLRENFYKVALDGAAKSTVDSLRRPMILDFWMTVPPSDEQDAIVALVESETATIDALVEKTRCSIELLTEYRTALISAAVTGQIEIPAADSGEDVA